VSFVGTVHYAGLGAFVASASLYFRAEEEGAAAANQCDVEAAQLEQQAAQVDCAAANARHRHTHLGSANAGAHGIAAGAQR
jgi:hypothetical protein